jgi:hypothetical protein
MLPSRVNAFFANCREDFDLTPSGNSKMWPSHRFKQLTEGKFPQRWDFLLRRSRNGNTLYSKVFPHSGGVHAINCLRRSLPSSCMARAGDVVSLKGQNFSEPTIS